MAPLNEQQKYLLNRLPGRFDRCEEVVTEPREITSARKLIAAYEGQLSKIRIAQKKAFEKALKATREAIYFKPADKALEVIKAFEDKFETKVG